jgi:hypothetical protein
VPRPAVHRSDELLKNAGEWRTMLGDQAFFEKLQGGGVWPGASAGGLAAMRAQRAGWTAKTFEAAAAAPPGTPMPGPGRAPGAWQRSSRTPRARG